MSDFLKTPTGKKFYEKDVPALITQLQRLGNILESIQKDQKQARIEENRRFKMDNKKMIIETIEAYVKAQKLNEDGKA
jgi:hypothetical protein